jgi:hypothetical protein
MEGEKINVKIGDWFSIEVEPTERGLAALTAALNAVKLKPRDALDELIVDDAPEKPTIKQTVKASVESSKKTRAPWGSKTGKRKGRTAKALAPNKNASNPNSSEAQTEQDDDKEKLLDYLKKYGTTQKSAITADLWPKISHVTANTRMKKLLKECPEVEKKGWSLQLKGADTEPEEESDDGEGRSNIVPFHEPDVKHIELHSAQAKNLAYLFRGWNSKPFTLADLIETTIIDEVTATAFFEDFRHNNSTFYEALEMIGKYGKRQLVASACQKGDEDAMIISCIGGGA